MYIRLLVTIPLSLYTSRVLLKELGVDDYGIYTAVNGMIAMFTVLRAAFASASQRFYNVALASNDKSLLRKMFSTSIYIHILILIMLFIGIEAFGLWFIENRMEYPIERKADVYFVFHFMMISIIFVIMRIPFDGMIIAKEKMDFYAYLTIIDVVLKLLLVLLLLFLKENKLHLYTIFQLCVTIFTCLIAIIYCQLKFKIGITKGNWRLATDMGRFAGWGLIGNLGYALANQGIILLVNMFGGVVANAAQGIVEQVRSTLGNVINNTIVPASPQAVQVYVNGESTAFYDLIFRYSRLLFILTMIMVIPLFLYCQDILHLWLGIVPNYTLVFMQLILCYLIIRSLHEPLDLIFKSSGRLRSYQLISICLEIVTFISCYVALDLGSAVCIVFVIKIITEMLLIICLVKAAKKDGLPEKKYYLQVILPLLSTLLIAWTLSCFICTYIPNIFIGIPICVVLVGLCSYRISITPSERNAIWHLVKSKINRGNS